MMDIHKKELRRELINRYLNAEATPTEERLLFLYYLENKEVDKDEQPVFQMIRMENIYTSLLSEEGVKEYDRIVNKEKRQPKKISFRWISWIGGVAASIVLLFILNFQPASKDSETIEMAQCIQKMMNLDMEDMISITATPVDECVWVKTELKDGSTKTFIMYMDENNETTTLLAIN